VLEIILAELKTERQDWENGSIYAEYKRLIGFDLLITKGLQDMLSDDGDLLMELMAVYRNINRFRLMADTYGEEANKAYFLIDEKVAMEKRDYLLKTLADKFQLVAIAAIDKCIPQVEKRLNTLGSKLEGKK
jgi:hypothetical protein